MLHEQLDNIDVGVVYHTDQIYYVTLSLRFLTSIHSAACLSPMAICCADVAMPLTFKYHYQHLVCSIICVFSIGFYQLIEVSVPIYFTRCVCVRPIV